MTGIAPTEGSAVSLPSPAAIVWQTDKVSSGREGREINEDSTLVAPKQGVFAVADGMGGHADGGVASRSLTAVIGKLVSAGAPFEQRVNEVVDASNRANAALYAATAKLNQRAVSGTTLAALVVGQSHAAVLWAGDSRVYLLRDDRLYQLTQDHAQAVSIGQNRRRYVLTRAVGSAATVPLSRLVAAVRLDDRFLICTDGVCRALTQEKIAQILSEVPVSAAAVLLAEARRAGSRDDASAIVIDALPLT